jgi:hypothetical protein
VTLADIALANELAHEVLGRTLDELPPQTRRLLGLVIQMVEEHCAAQQVSRAQHRFSRRAVREYTRWGDTQLKIHLSRLTELEYVLVHRGGRGQSFEYELLFDGETNTDAPHASGLIDIDTLTRDYDAERSGGGAPQSGPSRPSIGTLSGEDRPVPSLAYPEKTSASRSLPPSSCRSKRRVMKWRRSSSSKSRHSLMSMPASRAIRAYAYSITVKPFGSSSSLSLLPVTPSNLRSQYPNPGGAGTWPERTSFVSGFQAMIAFARAHQRTCPRAEFARARRVPDRARKQRVAEFIRQGIRKQAGQARKKRLQEAKGTRIPAGDNGITSGKTFLACAPC